MKKQHESKNFSFRKRAASYDAGIEGRMSQKFYNLVLQSVELYDGCFVLDVGCGTGALLKRMAAHKQIISFGIDAEAKMVEVARKNCPEMDIQQSRSENMPFDDQTFDVITVCMAYHHFADKEGFALEASRVLKPGGSLYIADPRFPAPVQSFLNGVFRLINVAGEFFSYDRIEKRFASYGFVLGSVAVDGYAQVVKLRKDVQNCST
ncbi:MAG: class I SAM-dependent methyltransferase [Oscillospiraceae bacterium]|nr:class I SAM-dependent methyltransferase [Oscillospiraceae bacterium]